MKQPPVARAEIVLRRVSRKLAQEAKLLNAEAMRTTDARTQSHLEMLRYVQSLLRSARYSPL